VRLIAGAVRVMVMMLAAVIALEQLRIGQAAILILAKEWLQAKMKPHEPEEEVFHHL
jgi:hypothetical protein